MKPTTRNTFGSKGTHTASGLRVRTRLQAGEAKYTFSCDDECKKIFQGFKSLGYINYDAEDGIYTVTQKGSDAWGNYVTA